MATTILMAVPTKRASEVNIVKPLRNLISSHYNSADNPEDYTEAINELGKLRSQALWKVLDKYDNSLELIYTYYDQITSLESKVPPSEVQIPFKWKDAFNKMTSFFANGKVSITLCSFAYERICVLFNIAAQQSAIASAQNLETDDGLKMAAKLFQQSAGIFNTLKTTVMNVIQQDPTPDLNPDTLAMLSSLMLAQAQEVFIVKANIDKMKDQTIAKLCAQCEEFYADTAKMMERETVMMSLDKEWTSNVYGKQSIFHGLAQYYQAMVCKANKTVGEQIARLNVAIAYIKVGQERCARSYYNDRLNKAIQELTEAKKDNDFIYHERIPDIKHLELISKVAIAKPTPVPSKFSSKFKDLFEDLVPISVQQALSAYDVRKTELVNSEIGKLRESTQILNGCLASLNLPAALEDVKGVGIPQSLVEKSNSIRMNGGVQRLENMIRELPELLKRNEEIINESERMLNEEQASDEQLQAQFKEKWNRTKSNVLTQVFKVNITKYREIIKNAKSADKMIHEKFETHKRAIYLLSEGQEAMQNVLPVGSNTGVNFANSTAADKLKHLMEEVEALKNERDVIETELKCATTDMKSKFLNALSEEGSIHEANLSTESLDQSYGHLKAQVNDSLARQDKLLSNIQVVNTEFCREKSSGGQRESLFKDLASGYDVFNDLQSNLVEGTKFYNDLTEVLVKLNLLNPVIELMFNILSEETDDDTWFLEEYSLSPMSAAGDCMAAIADELSASTFMPIMIKLIDAAHTTQDPNALKASYTTMAFVSDGCSEYLKKNYLKQFVTAIKMGLNSSNETVKSAAMYALGEVSQYVQPQVSTYAAEILPELMKMFKEKLIIEYTKPECSSEVRMIFYALDKFIDSMEGGVDEYLPEMIGIVMDIIRNEECCIELKDKAITIMCSIVKSGGDATAPYFIPVMEILEAYLKPGIDVKLETLQIMVIQLLSEFAVALDPKVFEPYLDISLKCGLALLQEAKEDQPEVRAVCYGLFSSIARVSINHLLPYLDLVMQHVLKSLDNSLIADNSFNLEKKKFNAYSSDDDDEDDKDESLTTEDDGSNDGDSDDFVYVDAHVMEEKDNACQTIAQIAQSTGDQFLPYLNNSFEVVSKLLQEDDEDTIDSVLELYGQICIYFSKLPDNCGQESLEKALENYLKYGEKKIQEDGFPALDSIYLDVLADMLKEIKTKMIKYAEPIMILAKSILALKIGDVNNPGELDELDSENDTLPIEYAGNVVSNLSYVLPPQVFTEYFISLVPLLKKLMSKESSDLLRAAGLAITGESAKGLGENASGLCEIMFSLVIPLVEDEDDTVRNNAVFALGEIAFYGKESVYKYYPIILNTFSQVVTKEQRSKVLDNVYGALARMIITNIEGMPLDHVVPVMINYLPLHEDFVENLTVFKCLVYLYEIGNQYMVSMLEPVVKASLATLSDKRKYYEDDVKEEIIKLLRMYKRDFPEKCLSLTLPEDLSKLFNET